MNCLFCGSQKITKANYPRPTNFNGKTFFYQQCSDCQLIFIDPVPSSDDYNKMYASSYHEEFYFQEKPTDHSTLLRQLNKNVGEKIIVDYGCGDGSFLRFFLNAGYKCIGVEYDAALVEKLKQKNPQISFFTVDEFWANENPFSVIYFGDVLEHLDKPAEFLQKIYSKLPANGLLMAQGPLENNNNLGLLFRKLTSSFVSREKKIAAHTPYHISFTNATNQENLFKNSGFESLYYDVNETPWPYPAKFDPKPVSAFQYLVGQTSVLISKITPSKLGNRFIYIGKKK